jgi:hypothetical protein
MDIDKTLKAEAKILKKAFKDAKNHKEVLKNLRKIAEERAKEILCKHKDIKLIILHGSVGRELSGDKQYGSVVCERSDIDLGCFSLSDIKKLKTEWEKNTPHWLAGSIALYDPNNLLPELKAKYAKWNIEQRKKIIWHLWMETLSIKSSALLFLEKNDFPAALWASRKAYERVLDVTLLVDNFVPCTPKYDWHCLRKNIKRTLIKLHKVDIKDKKAVKRIIIEADNSHWRLKEELEKFLGKKHIFEGNWDSVRFPIIKWL